MLEDDDMTINDISKLVMQIRLNNSLSQQEFADLLGVSKSLVSTWETGKNHITVEMLLNIFDKFNIPFSTLLPNGFSEKEIRLILSYRQKSDFQKAIDSLLQID